MTHLKCDYYYYIRHNSVIGFFPMEAWGKEVRTNLIHSEGKRFYWPPVENV